MSVRMYSRDSLRGQNGGRLPTIKECIKEIEGTYGGCTYLGSHIGLSGKRIHVFDVPARTWSPTTYFTEYELRWTFIHGW